MLCLPIGGCRNRDQISLTGDTDHFSATMRQPQIPVDHGMLHAVMESPSHSPHMWRQTFVHRVGGHNPDKIFGGKLLMKLSNAARGSLRAQQT
jgi:hypothetical protein